MRYAAKAAILAMMFLATAPAAGSAQDLVSDIDRVSARLQAAAAANLNLIAPEAFAKARQKLTEAQSVHQRGANPTEVRKKLDEALVELSRAESLEALGKVVLQEAINARADALVANAPEADEDNWRDGERALRDAGRKLEDGDNDDAGRKAAEATTAYREAEFTALRQELVSTTERLRKEAKDRKADRKAATTFLKAEAELAAAEQALRENRDDLSQARMHAEAASAGYRRASRISLVVDAVDRSRNAAVEKLVLDYEGYLDSTATTLNFDADFTEGAESVAQQILDAINGLKQDRDALREDLAAQTALAADLRSSRDSLQFAVDSIATQMALQADSLTAQQARQEAESRRLAAQLAAREERQQKIDNISALFDASEAEVSVVGSDVVIRLNGMNFAVGSAQVRPENFALLTKLQRALREFPDHPIQVAGHTDSRGNPEVNQSLSERRADAIRQYLVANMAMAESQIMAIGYGETQPLASNETAEGRAQNRRIDVRIILPPI